jgi:methylglyoxal synthase
LGAVQSRHPLQPRSPCHRHHRVTACHRTGLEISRFVSGPLGGDQQVGAAIVEGRVDFVIFFWDPLEPHPHDVDVKALLRIAVVYNIPIACNRSSADFLLSSTLMSEPYERRIMDYEALVGAE